MDMLIEGVWFSRITSVIRELLRWVWPYDAFETVTSRAMVVSLHSCLRCLSLRSRLGHSPARAIYIWDLSFSTPRVGTWTNDSSNISRDLNCSNLGNLTLYGFVRV